MQAGSRLRASALVDVAQCVAVSRPCRLSAGNLLDNLLAVSPGKRWASIPAFTRTVDRRGNVSIGMIRRQCTTSAKIEPIRRKVRELTGLTRKRSPRHACEPMAGHLHGRGGADEAEPRGLAGQPVSSHREADDPSGLPQLDQKPWLSDPPKSACIGCPFHSNAMWRNMRDRDLRAWNDAVEVDRAIRTGLRGIRRAVFLHRSGVPLDEVDLSTATDHGLLDLWPNECEGMCGL